MRHVDEDEFAMYERIVEMLSKACVSMFITVRT